MRDEQAIKVKQEEILVLVRRFGTTIPVSEVDQTKMVILGAELVRMEKDQCRCKKMTTGLKAESWVDASECSIHKEQAELANRRY